MLLIGALIAAFPLSSMLWYFFISKAFENAKEFFLTLSIVLGAIGYAGLWASVIFDAPKNYRLNDILLFCGLCGFLSCFVYNGKHFFIELRHGNVIENLFEFIFPPVVAFVTITDNVLHYKKFKRAL